MTKKGQSIIEYVLIATLIILGIYFMGPYVLRSINAHYKLWDEGVQDSFQENLKQAPSGDLPIINATCQCTPSSEGCGTTLCGGGAIEQDWSCTPIGCNGASRAPTCTPSDSCCTTWFQGACGTVPLNQTVPTNTPIVGATNCNYGQRIYSTLCPDLGIECKTDSTCPQPVCTGFMLFPGSTNFCSGTATTSPGLIQDTPYQYVGNGNGNCSGGQCEVYCNPPFVVNSTGDGCALQYTVAASPSNPAWGPSYPATSNDQSCNGPSDHPGCPSLPAGCWQINNVTTIKSVISVPYGGGGTCTDNPPNSYPEPGQQCAIAISF